MNSKMALYLLIYGIGLMALALLTNRAAPEMARVTLITGLAGGGLCALWGVLGLLGHRRRGGAIVTLILVCLALVTQTINGWLERSEGLLAPTLMTLMLVASVGILMYVLHGNRPPEFYFPSRGNEEDGKHQSK